jgi:hypothetical protein
LQALYAANQVLLAGKADEVVVLAADILSRSNQNNFEVLRVLSNSTMTPWQPTSGGFILGEAAVALKLVRAKADDENMTWLTGPVLGNELNKHDGLPRIFRGMMPANPNLVLGQGTGPVESDEAELSAFRGCFEKSVPLATPLVHFGHTLGASGLLSVALGALIQRTGAWHSTLAALAMPTEYAPDGRPLLCDAATKSSHTMNENGVANILISSRALNGSCAAATVGTTETTSSQPEKVWHSSTPAGPLMHVALRRLAAEALQHRPAEPPDVLLVQLEAPLSPPPEATIGGRLLPSSVLEITPGFVPQLIARCWGYAGPALCLVGKTETVGTTADFQEACKVLGLVVAHIKLLGIGDNREIEWNK